MKPQELLPGHRIVTDKFGTLTVDREVVFDVGPEAAQRFGTDYRSEDDRVYVDVEVSPRADISDPAVLAKQAGAVDAQFVSLVPKVRYRLCFRPGAEVRCDEKPAELLASDEQQMTRGFRMVFPDGYVLHGAQFPSGRCVLDDTHSGLVHGSVSLAQVQAMWPLARIEWAEGRPPAGHPEWTWRHNQYIADRTATTDRTAAERAVQKCRATNPGDDVALVVRTVTEWADVECAGKG